ncbi:hypothetical protein D3C74_474690 [compost metagenome]
MPEKAHAHAPHRTPLTGPETMRDLQVPGTRCLSLPGALPPGQAQGAVPGAAEDLRLRQMSACRPVR